MQNEVMTKSAIIAVKGSVNAAVLKDCGLIATKPVHFLSTCCEEIKWVEKTCLTWDKVIESNCPGTVMHLCVNDLYNMHMGYVEFSN